MGVNKNKTYIYIPQCLPSGRSYWGFIPLSHILNNIISSGVIDSLWPSHQHCGNWLVILRLLVCVIPDQIRLSMAEQMAIKTLGFMLYFPSRVFKNCSIY